MINRFRFTLLILTTLFILGCKEKTDTLVAGTNINCATHNGAVSCWGKETSFPPDYLEGGGWTYKVGWIRKQYVDPVVTVGVAHFCVLDDGLVECFNDQEFTVPIPDLDKPYEIAAGSDFTCALDANGLICWGNTFSFDELPETLYEPFNLVAGLDHICVQDRNGFYCDGFTWSGNGKPTPPENLNNPSKVTTSPDSGITCALQDQWSCWYSEHQINDPLFFNAPDADIVVPGAQQTCSLTDGEISCVGFGVMGPTGVEVPSHIVNPRNIDIAGIHACAISDWGVGCWSPIGILSPVNVPPYL